MTTDAGPVLRPHAEEEYADELEALAAADAHPRPPHWQLSPWAVVDVPARRDPRRRHDDQPKYIGPAGSWRWRWPRWPRTGRSCSSGCPGTAKTWMSEHLAAAISGDSTLLVQGTAGTPEEALRYGWNYARLLAEGPSEQALVPSPVLRAMRSGALVRVEELTRIPSDVQDALITILSEKTLPIPELGLEVQATKGFNAIATANDRDRGVNELSSALRRRFNTVLLPLPASADDEVAIVGQRVAAIGRALELPDLPAADAEIRRVVTVFRELRSGATEDGRISLKVPTATLSPAEAISVVTNGLSLAAHFGDGAVRPADLADSVVGAVVKDPVHDVVAWREYVEGVAAGPAGLGRLLPACRTRCEPTATGARPVTAAAVVRLRHPPPRPGLGAVRAGARSTRSIRRWCASRARPRPSPCWTWPPIRTWSRPSRSWPTTRTDPTGPRSGRSPRSARSGRRCGGRRSTAARCGSSTCPPRTRWPVRTRRTARACPTTAGAAGRRGRLRGRRALVGRPGRARRWRDVFEAVEEAMAAVRGDQPAARVARELRREAAMRRALGAVVADGFGRVAVVCGAWHVPALRAAAAAPPTRPLLRGLPKARWP